MAFNSNPGKQQFIASASQTVFNFNFAIFADTDIKVYKTLAGAIANDTTDILTISTHYTVSINGTLGGTVTLLSGAGLNDTITIVRSLPVSRTTDYVTNGDLYADTLDADQDYQTYLVQDGYVQLERAIIIPESISGVNLDIPAPVGDSYLRWNTAGNALENDTTIPQAIVDATTQASIATTQATNASASAASASSSASEASISASSAAASAASVNDTNLVHITGTETITGAKTFTSGIITPNIPLSGVTAYHLLDGSVSLSNTVITAGMATTLYTGNGTTQSVVTSVDMATQWGNSATETFGGLVWLKGRSTALNHMLFDTVRGTTNTIQTNTTNAQSSNANSLTAFSSTGFSVGSDVTVNTNLATQASWVFQTTHRITGTTNHGKAYTCHYNPFTGFTTIQYEGSGLAGHEIPHHLGRKLGFVTTKNLSAVTNWASQYTENLLLKLNLTDASASVTDCITGINEASIVVGVNAVYNTSAQQYIMYGWANSYFDESNTLIGNYEVGVYQGTGAAGNKVTTRGKPAWVMIKRLDSTSNWTIKDNLRPLGSDIWANLSNAETVGASSAITLKSDGFTLDGASGDTNTSGGQYLYMVVYDNDSGSGKSKYNKATDTSAININATLPLAKGLDLSGSKVSVVAKNETITGVTLTQGENYVYYYE